jgi:hypothetical protein
VNAPANADLRAYLLGHATPEDAERVEARLLEDQDVFDAVREAEHDLFDEYARGRLAAGDRARFLERFGTQTDRIAFARALAARTGGGTVLRFARFTRPRWIQAAAAALLVVAAGSVLLTRRHPEKGPYPFSPEIRTAPSAGVTVAVLTLGTSRAASTAASVALPKKSAALELHIRLDPADRFDSYSVSVRSSANAIVWQAANLPAAVVNGELTITATIDASALAAGSYEVAVQGNNNDVLGYQTLTISRTP